MPHKSIISSLRATTRVPLEEVLWVLLQHVDIRVAEIGASQHAHAFKVTRQGDDVGRVVFSNGVTLITGDAVQFLSISPSYTVRLTRQWMAAQEWCRVQAIAHKPLNPKLTERLQMAVALQNGEYDVLL